MMKTIDGLTVNVSRAQAIIIVLVVVALVLVLVYVRGFSEGASQKSIWDWMFGSGGGDTSTPNPVGHIPDTPVPPAPPPAPPSAPGLPPQPTVEPESAVVAMVERLHHELTRWAAPWNSESRCTVLRDYYAFTDTGFVQVANLYKNAHNQTIRQALGALYIAPCSTWWGLLTDWEDKVLKRFDQLAIA